MSCELCNSDYMCENCKDKRSIRRLSPLAKVKIIRYMRYLKGDVEPDQDMFDLMLYFSDNDIDASLSRII